LGDAHPRALRDRSGNNAPAAGHVPLSLETFSKREIFKEYPYLADQCAVGIVAIIPAIV
jgi:hypothetical protein